MRPRSLSLQNFLCFQETEVDLGSLRGLVLLSGEHRGSGAAADSNGAGKSALIDGLTWALYGKTSRPRHRAEDVVRRAAAGDTMVRLAFDDALGRAVEIRRYRKHSRYRDGLFLDIDGADARGSSGADTQKRIDAIVGVDRDTFVGSVLYTQHPLHGRFAELPDEQKKDLLESILGVEVLSRARDLCKRDLRAREADVTRTEARTQSLVEQIGWMERQRDEHAQRAATWDKEREGRRAVLRARIDTQRLELEDLRRREPAGMAPGSAARALADAMRALEQAEAEARRQDAECERQVSDARTRQTRASTILASLREEARRFAALGERCPICTQTIGAGVRASHAEHLEDQMAEPARALLEARSALQRAEGARTEARRISAERRRQLEQHVNDLRAAQEAERLDATRREAWEREHRVARDRLRDLEGQLAAIELEENAFVPLVAKLEDELADRRAEHARAAAELEGARTVCERLAFWDRGFGPRGLKSFLLDSVVPLLNERARFYGDLLTAGTLSVQFSTTVEKDEGLEDRFTVNVQHRSGVDSYALLSGGERQRCNLVINLALQDLVASRAARPLPIAIYDEAFEGLDRTGVEAAVRVLSEAARDKDLVLVVTHQEALKDLFAHELRVVCERGRSFVETRS